MDKKIRREKKTLQAMVNIYCRVLHGSESNLCTECNQLIDYACRRVDSCILGENKTTCARCTVHCFKPELRDKIKKVMRHSGPRMIYKHPLLTIYHLLDSRTKQSKT